MIPFIVIVSIASLFIALTIVSVVTDRRDKRNPKAVLSVKKSEYRYGDTIYGELVLKPRTRIPIGTLYIRIVGRYHNQHSYQPEQIGSSGKGRWESIGAKTIELHREVITEIKYNEIEKGQTESFKFEFECPRINKKIRYYLDRSNGADTWVYWRIETDIPRSPTHNVFLPLNLIE